MGDINKRLKELKTKLDPKVLAKEAYNKFYATTPIRTGNARSNTDLIKNEIEANYPYAQRLDDGYSKQAPRGMTEPTREYIRKYIKQQGK